MNLLIACALVCISLHFALANVKWEVLNDVKPFDDTGTQEDILSQEQLIPYKPSRPKSKAKPAPKALSDKNGDIKSHKTVFQAPLPKFHPDPKVERSEVEEDELLPLGVPHQRGQRRILQVDPIQGPVLPPEMKARRLLARSGAVNLSSGCRDVVDGDCRFDVDDLVARQKQADTVPKQQENDFDFVDQDENGHHQEGNEEEMRRSLSRRRRQATSTDKSTSDDDDSVEEGSGILSSSEDLYKKHEEFTNAGSYEMNATTGVHYPEDPATFDNKTKKKYKQDFEKQLEEALNGTFPGFEKVVVGDPKLENGSVVVIYTIIVNGAAAASALDDVNLEEKMRARLRDAVVPALLKMNINGILVDPALTPADEFVINSLDTLSNYCGSTRPCPDLGREYSQEDCVPTGFMTGICPHKCQSFPCQNNAVCMISDDFTPYCNCGSRYTGTYCQNKKKKEKKLSTGEKMGVGVAGAVGCLAAVSFGIYFIVYRRRNRPPEFTYYEDEGETDHLSDPTSMGRFYIDRPTFCQTPISAFNLQGFEA